ncbi:MAG TPA: FG-GAP-like repeat-containing protein [Jiangellales bacterium]|nr:FG-GAP-like repeat-containing protein [Jiangellales bacterium]
MRMVRLVLAGAVLPAAVVLVPVAAVPTPTPRPVPPDLTSAPLDGLDPSGRREAGAHDPADTRDLAAGPTDAAGPERTGTPAPTAAPGDPVVAITAALEVPDVAVLGVTWDPGASPAEVAIRLREGAVWTPWTPLPLSAEHGPDPGAAEDVGARPGSDPVVVSEDEVDVQVRVSGEEGGEVDGLRLEVVDAGESAADAAVGTAAPGTADAAPARPAVLTRQQWGADESIRGAPSYGRVRAGFVHHTVSSNSYTADQVPAIIRGIYAYHVKSRGWKDIGYNFLVDRFGRIWEGRYGGVDRPVIGAHTSGYNGEAFAMSAIGDFTSTTPSDAVIDAYGRLFGWKLALHGVDPTVTTRLGGTAFRTVSGHRDAGSTECPGQRLYDRLGTIRSLAKAHQGSFSARDPQRVAAPNGAPDLAGLGGTRDRLLLSQGDGGRGFLAPGAVGRGWSGFDPVGAGRWDGDPHPDLLAVERATGLLWLYPGNGTGGWQPRRQVGTKWTSMRHVVGIGDWDGDGRRDLLAVDGAHRLWLYSGNGRGGFLARRQIGSGWGVMDLLVSVGDWDRDGRPDLVAREAATGVLWLYPGNGVGGALPRRQIGSGWGGMRSVVGPGDWDGDKRPDLLAVDRAGDVWLYPRTSSGSFATRVRVRSGWREVDAVAAVGNWDGKGGADLLARSGADGRLILHPGSGGRRFVPGHVAAPPGGRMDAVVIVGDWSGDGRVDVVGRAVNGALNLWRGRGDGTFQAASAIGAGWGGMSSLAAGGDWDGDGRPDLMALERSSGSVWQYRANGSGGFLARRKIGAGLGRFDLLVGVGRWDADGAPDLLAREASTGALYLFAGNGPGGLLPPRRVGKGWQTMDLVVGVGDADGDGRRDLVARERASGALWLYPGDGIGGFRPRVAVGPEWASWGALG